MNNCLTLVLKDTAATQHLGTLLAKIVTSPLHIYLQGEIGMGKTTLVRAMLQQLGATGAIKSPSFSLIEPYELPHVTVYHFDLYRLTEAEELEYLAWRDYFAQDAICCVEWPERATGVLAAPDLWLTLTLQATGRHVTCQGLSLRGRKMLVTLANMVEGQCNI